jgi:hypothetical protein
MVNINEIRWGGSGIEKIVFDHICDLLPEGKTILEFGSGYVSTGAFSTRYNVISIDQDQEYQNKFAGVTYIHAPLIDGWFDPFEIHSKLQHNYDLIFVDAPSGSGNRSGFLTNLALFKLTVPIIIHDTYRTSEIDLALGIGKALKKKPEFFNKGGDSWALIK